MVVMLVVTALTARMALAHVDGLGAPDPYWQKIASASGSGADSAADAASANRGAAVPRLRRFFVYGSGVAFVVLAASLLRSLLSSTRRPPS
jgi:hypothetical protein